MPHTSLTRLKNLGTWRDALLVLTGSCYALGYLSWATYAADIGLGSVPVVDAQYIVAGIAPLLVATFCAVLFWGLWKLTKWSRGTVSEHRKKRAGGLFRVSVSVGAIGAILVWLGSAPLKAVGAIAIATGIFGFYVTAIVGGKPHDAMINFTALALVWFYAALMPVFLFMGYVLKVFPQMSQSYGGPAVRCVTLDLDRARLSDSTLVHLAPGQRVPAEAKTVRTDALDLLFDGAQNVIVERRDTASAQHAREKSVRLPQATVLAVVPCRRGGLP